MLPDGPLAKKQLSKLKMYYGEKHPHSSQNPTEIKFSQLNRKNYIKNYVSLFLTFFCLLV